MGTERAGRRRGRAGRCWTRRDGLGAEPVRCRGPWAPQRATNRDGRAVGPCAVAVSPLNRSPRRRGERGWRGRAVRSACAARMIPLLYAGQCIRSHEGAAPASITPNRCPLAGRPAWRESGAACTGTTRDLKRRRVETLPSPGKLETKWRRPRVPLRRNRNSGPFSSRERTRTSDPVINSHLLYQLSYAGSCVPASHAASLVK
jgi:hypothetical protein